MTKPVGVRLVAEGAGKYVGDLKNAGSATRGFAAEATAAGTQAKSGSSAMATLGAAGKSLISTLKNVGFAAGVMAGTFKVAWSTLGQAAELQLATNRFDKLAVSINTTADALLGRLQEATRGMLSDAELMASASQLISLGLADNQEDVVRLATLVSELGWDMNQVILTFANNSKMRLDALGLSIEDVETRMKALEAQGYNTDKAFDLAVIEAGEAKLALLGSAAGTTAGDMRALTADLADLKNQLLETWVAMAGPTVAAAAGRYGDEVERIVDANLAAAGSFDELVKEGQKLVEVQKIWGGLGPAITGTGDEIRAGLDKVILGLALTADSAEDFDAGIKEIFGPRSGIGYAGDVALSNLARELGVTREELFQFLRTMQNRQALQEFTGDLEDLARAGREAGAGLAEGTRATAEEIRRTERILFDYGLGFGMTTREMEEMAYATGELGNGQERLKQYIEEDNAALAAQQEALQAAAEAAEAARLAYAGYFQQAIANRGEANLFTVAITDLGEQMVVVGGRTAQQNADLDALEKAYGKATQSLRNYELGITGANLSEEKRAEKMAELREQIGLLETQMISLNSVTGDATTQTNALTVNTDVTNQMLYESAAAAGASAAQLATLGVRLGILTEEEAEAALQQAALNAEIVRLGEAVANGELTIGEAINALRDFETQLETTGSVAVGVGQDIAGGMAQGVRDGTSGFVNAINEMVQKGMDTARQAAGAFSPSRVMMELGHDLVDGLTIGLAEGHPEIEDAMMEIRDIIDRALFRLDIQDIKNNPEMKWKPGTQQYVDSLFGGKIDAILGLTREDWERMRDLAREFGEEAGRQIQGGLEDTIGGGGLAEGLEGLFDLAGGFSSFTRALITRFEAGQEPMLQEMEQLDTMIKTRTEALGLEGMSQQDIANELILSTMRGDTTRANSIRTLLDWMSQRNGLEMEYTQQQEELLRIQKQMADLQFLQQQMEFLKFIQEAGRADLLEGLKLGLDADLPALLDAMSQAMQSLIDQANDDLEASSPSKVFMRMGENVMESFKAGLGSVSISGLDVVGPILPPAAPADIYNRTQTSIINHNRTIHFTGNYASEPAIRDRDDLAFAVANM